MMPMNITYEAYICFQNLHQLHEVIPWWLRGYSVCLLCRRPGFDPWVGKIPWRRKWQPTPVFLPGESHGRRSLVGFSPRGRKESDTTERLHSHFSLSCIGGGNSNPLQCSCLENPRDGGAWWAAVYGVAQSSTRLKRLSSSSISLTIYIYYRSPGEEKGYPLQYSCQENPMDGGAW